MYTFLSRFTVKGIDQWTTYRNHRSIGRHSFLLLILLLYHLLISILFILCLIFSLRTFFFLLLLTLLFLLLYLLLFPFSCEAATPTLYCVISSTPSYHCPSAYSSLFSSYFSQASAQSLSISGRLGADKSAATPLPPSDIDLPQLFELWHLTASAHVAFSASGCLCLRVCLTNSRILSPKFDLSHVLPQLFLSLYSLPLSVSRHLFVSLSVCLTFAL